MGKLYDIEPDFRAKIRFYTEAEGGRKSLPFQGYRSDLRYKNDEEMISYMMWPEFLDNNGESYEKGVFIKNYKLSANFYIVNREAIESYHKGRINIGVEFFILEGRPVGEGKIIEVFNKSLLNTNG